MANIGDRNWNRLLDAIVNRPEVRLSPLCELLLGPLLVPFTVRLCRTALGGRRIPSENASVILRDLIDHYSYIFVYENFNQDVGDGLLHRLQFYGSCLPYADRDDLRECGLHVVVGSVISSLQRGVEWPWFTGFYGEGFTLYPQRATMIARILINWFGDVDFDGFWEDFVGMYTTSCVVRFTPNYPTIKTLMIQFYSTYCQSHVATERRFGRLFCEALEE